jgi:cytochrome c-type biogenesis protein CcmH
MGMNMEPMRRTAIWIVLVAGLILIMIPPAAAAGQSPTPPAVSDDKVNAVARNMYCPICENVPLDVCPTQACSQWRDLIREKLAQGWTPAQVQDYFVQQYGDRVLAEPPRRGLNLLVYILPPVVILIAAYILFRVLRKMRRSAALPVVPPSTAEDDYIRRLEEELRRREKE